MRYWGECVLTATYIINRLPTKILNNKSPYELLYKRKPTYSHLRSFGCLCFPTTLKTHKDKFEPRETPHIFVGYPFNTKGYKVLDLATKIVHVSRDVLFHEAIFPFVVAPNGSSFDSVLKLVIHPTKLSFIPSKMSIFANDDLLETYASPEIANYHPEPVPNQDTTTTAQSSSLPNPHTSVPTDAPSIHAPR